MKPDPTAIKTTKRIATRYYQLKTGHAVIVVHLKRIKTIPDDRCWWCNLGDRQSVKHLVKECRKWRKEREEIQKGIKKHLWINEDIKFMFADREATPAIIQFLTKTEVGNRTSEKTMERSAEKRDENLGWEDLTRTEEEEEEEEERRREMEDRLREVDAIMEEVIREARTNGYMYEGEEYR
jgi:hypothetical protein